MLNKIFAWWNGATIGTLFTIAKRGRPVGEDEFGNKYYESKDNISSVSYTHLTLPTKA